MNKGKKRHEFGLNNKFTNGAPYSIRNICSFWNFYKD